MNGNESPQQRLRGALAILARNMWPKAHVRRYFTATRSLETSQGRRQLRELVRIAEEYRLGEHYIASVLQEIVRQHSTVEVICKYDAAGNITELSITIKVEPPS